MSTERPYHFTHLLQVSKKSLWSLILYCFFHEFSLRAGADSPQGTKFWCQQKCLVTSFICCKFKKNVFEVWFLYNFLYDLIHVYSPGQSRVIMWTNLVELEHPMLHTKFQGHRPFGSGEDLYRIWAWRPSWSCDLDHLNKLSFPNPKKAPYKNLASISPVVSEEKMFENVDIQHTYGWQRPTYTISSPMSLKVEVS